MSKIFFIGLLILQAGSSFSKPLTPHRYCEENPDCEILNYEVMANEPKATVKYCKGGRFKIGFISFIEGSGQPHGNSLLAAGSTHKILASGEIVASTAPTGGNGVSISSFDVSNLCQVMP
jgi:hypothetical protein